MTRRFLTAEEDDEWPDGRDCPIPAPFGRIAGRFSDRCTSGGGNWRVWVTGSGRLAIPLEPAGRFATVFTSRSSRFAAPPIAPVEEEEDRALADCLGSMFAFAPLAVIVLEREEEEVTLDEALADDV